MLQPDNTQAKKWRALRSAIAAADAPDRARLLADAADRSRRAVLRMIRTAKLGHVGGDLSVMDVLTCLYAAVLRIDPAQPEWADRDRFILSKGHCAGALYTTLAYTGFFPLSTLETFMAPLSPLNGHPDRTKVPGVETNTGPLGHGLPVAVGAAIAARLSGSERRVFVVLGDGELQEGSNWEAIMCAGHRDLDNLVAVVDRNRLQQGARTEATNRLDPLSDKWRSFGWDAVEVDGHDHLALLDAATTRTGSGRPTCIVANTVKGKGVSFMEDRVEWHHKVPSEEQFQAALLELTR
ncbi:MAG TPA: transketolase [Micromonosporaceae bacterium]|nr:transketolase [Micromonosporaceae bacterium]